MVFDSQMNIDLKHHVLLCMAAQNATELLLVSFYFIYISFYNLWQDFHVFFLHCHAQILIPVILQLLFYLYCPFDVYVNVWVWKLKVDNWGVKSVTYSTKYRCIIPPGTDQMRMAAILFNVSNLTRSAAARFRSDNPIGSAENTRLLYFINNSVQNSNHKICQNDFTT